MKSITKTIEVEIDLNPRELATIFASWSGGKQAAFFSGLDQIVKDTWEIPFEFQLQHITDSPCLTDGGRYIMGQIGEYSSREIKG